MTLMRKLLFPYDLIENGTDLSLIIYAELQNYCMYLMKDAKISLSTIFYNVYGREKVTKEERDNVIAALEWIENIIYKDGIITIRPDAMKCETNFAVINLEEYETIINRPGKFMTNISLFHYWCFIVRSFDWNIEKDGKRNFVGHMSLKYFAKQMQTTTTTIQRYNKCLEDLQLLYIVASRYNPETGARTPNNYGRYEDKDLINDFCNGNVDPSGNFKRSVAARYNCWLNNKNSVDIDELKADIIEYNKIVPQNMMILLT